MARTGPRSRAGGTPATLSESGPERRVTGLFIMLFLLYMFDYIDREIVSAMWAGLLFLAATAFYSRDLAKVDKVKIEMEA